MTDGEFVKACNSASLWFVAYYMEMFLERLDELKDVDSKEKIIEEIYNEGLVKGIDSIKARVNATYRIIKGNRVLDALNRAVESDMLKQENEEAYVRAKELLKKLENNRY